MQTTPYIQWPLPSKEELFFAIVGLVGFMVLAIGLELQRQYIVRRRALKREWGTADEVMADKDLGKREREMLHDVVARWAPKAPLQTITSRRHFERAIAAEMARAAAAGPAEAFESHGQALRDIRTKLSLDYAPIGQAILSTRDIYPAQIMEMQDDGASGWSEFAVRRLNEAYLYLRPMKSAPRAPAPGAYAKVRMWREEDARYAFNLRFERIDPADDAWVFHHSEDLNRYQARAHFRIYYDRTLPIAVARRTSKGAIEPHETERIRGRVTSLSAGGFAVQLQEPLDEKALLHVELDLEHIGAAHVVGEIVAVHPGAAGRYLVRVQFVGLDDEVRDTIARYVTFRQQSLSAADTEDQ